MLTNTLMLVRTHPQDPAREDEFNDWYNGNHVPDVLNAPNFEAALRYKEAATYMGEAPPYLALYYVSEDDVVKANVELMEYLNAPDPKRMVMPEATGRGDDWEIHAEGGGTRPGGLISVDTWAFYSKTIEKGNTDVSPEGAAKALLVVYAAPAEGADAEELSKWYDWHVDDILTTKGFRSSTRYELASINAGSAPQWCAIYELDRDDVEQVQADLGQVLAVAPSGAIPTLDDGRMALDVSGYIYMTLCGAPTKVHTLLPDMAAS
ncbi:MAG: hypothetical protein HOC70_11305 [Gammaproteobacteria bacterium]|nr:hypothetical protein [Gammaproteobacteria bacterium]MBT4493820.1 hypothetical protein [Gammaproteobacteria bacterium]